MCEVTPAMPTRGLSPEPALSEQLSDETFALPCQANVAHTRKSRPDYGLGFSHF